MAHMQTGYNFDVRRYPGLGDDKKVSRDSHRLMTSRDLYNLSVTCVPQP